MLSLNKPFDEKKFFNFFQILRNRFDEFKRTVETGSERYSRCERLAKWLLEDNTPYEDEVKERQEQLRYYLVVFFIPALQTGQGV